MTLAIEGAATADFTSGASSKAINITTSGTDRIVVVQVASESGTLRTVTGVAATGLTFTKRKALVVGDSDHTGVEVWWAYASAQLTALAITVSMSGAVDSAAVGVFAVSGVANFTNPWSANVSLPATNLDTGAGSTVQVTGVSTTETNCIVFGFYGASTGSNPGVETTPTAYTQISFDTNWNGTNRIGLFSEYHLFTSAQTGITVGTASSLTRWGMIADAITDAAAAPSGTTWNPSDKVAMTLTSGNLTASNSGAANPGVRGTDSKSSGKWYVEFHTLKTTFAGIGDFLGITTAAAALSGNVNGLSNAVAVTGNCDTYTDAGGGTFAGALDGFTDFTGHRIDEAFDLDNNKFWARIDGGNWNSSGTANPATNTGGIAITSGKTWFLAFGASTSGVADQEHATMAATAASQIGTIPSGFSAWDASVSGATGTIAQTLKLVTQSVIGQQWTKGTVAQTLKPIRQAATGSLPPTGTWASIEAKDAMDFHASLQGSWHSTEAKDAIAFAGGVLGGSWHSTDAKDAMASAGGVLGGSWHSTETTDSFAGHGPPSGTWTSTEGIDMLSMIVGQPTTFFDPFTASPGIDFQALDLTIVNQEAFGHPGAKSNTSFTTNKLYAEFKTRFSANNSGVGIGNASANFTDWGNGTAVGPGNGPAANGAGCFSYNNGTIWIDGVEQSNWSGSVALADATVRVAIDLVNNLIWFSVNGGYWNGLPSANPANGMASPRPPANQPQVGSGGYDISAITANGPIYLWAELIHAYDTVTLNPGNSAFAYSVPSGFVAWDTVPPISVPIQIDGYASNGVSEVLGPTLGVYNAPLMEGTVTLSTTQTDDVIVLGVSMGGYWNASTVDHVTSSSGLVWKRRNRRWQSGGRKTGASTIIDAGLDIEEWWAHAPLALSGEVITVHNTAAVGGMALVAFGVSGANYTTPWDTHTQAGGYVDNIGNRIYFPATAELSTKANNAILFGFHGDVYSDAGVTQAPWAYVTSALGVEFEGYNSFLSLVYQVVEEPQVNTDVVSGTDVPGVGIKYTAASTMFDSIVAAGETGTDHEIVWFWDPNATSSCLQLTTGTTMQLSYNAVNFNLMVIIEVAIMSASRIGTVTSISEGQGSLSTLGFERRSRTTTTTSQGPLAVEIWWGWMPMYTNAERPTNDTITLNTAHMQAGDIIGAIILGLGGTTGAFGLGDPFWDVNLSVPAMNSSAANSPPPYATDISTTVPSDLVVAWTANSSVNVPGYTDPFVTLVQSYPRTVSPIMQLTSVGPPLFTGFEFYYEPGLATSETAEFLQTPEPDGWIVIADAIPVGPPQPPSGTMHIHDQQDKFTHNGDYSEIGIVGPGGWVVLPAIHGIMTATDHADEFTGAPAFAPWLGEGWLGWVAAHAAWHSTEGYDGMALYGWVLGFGITGQLGAAERKDRQAFSNRTTVTGTMGAVETKDRWASAGLVLPPSHVRPTPPFKRRLLIVT